MKSVVPRMVAEQDIERAFNHYLNVAGPDVAMSFVDVLEQTISHISRNPSSGSSHYAHELQIPDLRHWPLRNFPYLIFCVEP